MVVMEALRWGGNETARGLLSNTGGPLPVSKWELKAKLGLKKAEDMTITRRVKSILPAAPQKMEA